MACVHGQVDPDEESLCSDIEDLDEISCDGASDESADDAIVTSGPIMRRVDACKITNADWACTSEICGVLQPAKETTLFFEKSGTTSGSQIHRLMPACLNLILLHSTNVALLERHPHFSTISIPKYEYSSSRLGENRPIDMQKNELGNAAKK